jgi:ABC-type glycerol-3-phosphate transport system substrate-binding protein
MCKAVTNPAQNRYGFGIPLADLHGWKTIWTFFQSNGVDLVNVDNNGKWYVDMDAEDRAAAAEVYQFLYRLVSECSPAGAVSYTQQNVRELVAQGTIMSRIDTPEIYYNVKSMDPDHLSDVKYFDFPARKARGSGIGWVCLCLPLKGNTALAADFVKFIYEGERLIPFYNSYPYAMFPGKKSLFESAQYRNNLPGEIKDMVPDLALEILSHSSGLVLSNGPFPNAGEVESRTTLNNPLNSMLIRGISPDQAVDQLISELEALLN